MTDSFLDPTPDDVPIEPGTPQAKDALAHEKDYLEDRIQDSDWESPRVRLTTHTAILAVQRYARLPETHASLSDAIQTTAGELVDASSPVDSDYVGEQVHEILADMNINFSSPAPFVSYLGQSEPNDSPLEESL